MSWKNVLGTIVLSLLGSAIGTALTLVSLGSIDLQKRDRLGAQQVASSVIEEVLLVNKANSNRDIINESKLAIYASPEVFGNYADYKEKCLGTDAIERDECKTIWAALIQSLRDDLNNDWLNKKDIIAVLWGPQHSQQSGVR